VRLPIRVRLTAWYVALLTAIVVGLGAFVVLQFREDMQAAIDRDLRRSWQPIAREYTSEGLEEFGDTSRMLLPRGAAAQVLDPDGRLLATWGGPEIDGEAIAPPGARDDALAGQLRLITVELGPEDEHYRALVAPVTRFGQRHVVVLAESLDEVESSVDRVLVLLLLAVPAALAATAFGGWVLARKALLPVDRITSEAERIGIARLHERIAVPRATDEVGHLAVTLNAMLDRLEQGVTEKQRLVADASHELRTPLAVMRAELDVSLRGGRMSAAARGVLESVREEVDRMSRTVDNLLTLAQVDEGRLELLTRRVRLIDAAHSAARPLVPLAEAQGVRLEVVAEGHPADVQADPHRLHQALTNLIENAIKFSPPGGEVRVTAWRRRWDVGVTVTDQGPGIPAEAREHVFDRFFRADHARGRTVGGSGLGLAICREVAHAHGGRMWVETEEGRGSAFTLALTRDPTRAPWGPDPAGGASAKLQTDDAEVTLRDS
jgi:heavy metal sensor kinase